MIRLSTPSAQGGIPVLYTVLTATPTVDIVWAVGAPVDPNVTGTVTGKGIVVGGGTVTAEVLTPAQIKVTWVELETTDQPTRIQVTWFELEVPETAGTATVTGAGILVGGGTVTATAGTGATATVTAGAIVVTGNDVEASGAFPVQFGRPEADISAGTWTKEDNSGTDLWQAIDETSANDSDYVKSALAPSADTFEVRLSDLSDPLSTNEHIVRTRIGKSASGTIDLVVSLRQGASTEIAAWTYPNIAEAATTIEETLTEGQRDAITDWADLRLRFVATAV
jgi:hypothetical protein